MKKSEPVSVSTRDRLLHVAAQCEQLHRELTAIGKPVSEGGADDISFAASHRLVAVANQLLYNARDLMRLAAALRTGQI